MFKKNTSALFMLVFFALLFTSGTVLSQSCKAELKVEKDRNFKSAFQNGAFFDMVLTNTSSQKDSYVISKRYLNTSCHNKALKSSEANVRLGASFLKNNKELSSSNVITLSPGETYKFQVVVDAPEAKDYNRWSCIEIIASSQNCRNVETTTTLSVYLPNPSGE